MESTGTPSSASWNVGAWLSYAHRPVELSDGNQTLARPVERQLSLDSFVAVGVMDRVAIRVSLPVVLDQSGDNAQGLAPGAEKLPSQALGDVALGAKATLLPTEDLGGFGLAMLARVTAPTGDPRSYVGEDESTGEFRLLSELKLIALTLGATAGAHFRVKERNYSGERFGHSLPFGAGVSLRPQALGLDDAGRWRWNAEVRGAVALTPDLASGPQTPVLAGLSARYIVDDVSAVLGVELPLSDAVGTPTVRPVLGVGWAPRMHDADNDGVRDELDECMELEEDRDGFEDSDGCPDWDNDDDGVADEDDQCPGEQEDEDDFRDDDGCIDADNDRDGVLDDADSCPLEAGDAQGERPGCPVFDADGDGILDNADKCPDQPEDSDGFEDTDGCPEADNDKDEIADGEDACPDQAGVPSSNEERHGCPSPDSDGDTIDDQDDKCPDQREDFDGDTDDDGCPDDDAAKPRWQRAQPLVTFEPKNDEWTVKWRVAPRFAGKPDDPEIDPKTDDSMRALATALNERPEWIVAVGVRPLGVTPEAEQVALTKAFAFSLRLRELTHRDGVAEVVSWNAVKGQPGAWPNGFGLLVFAPQNEAPGAKKSVKSPPAKSPSEKSPPKKPAPEKAP